jgi:hypothetical protein
MSERGFSLMSESNKPSPETISRLLDFLMETTVPRLIEEEKQKRRKRDEEENQKRGKKDDGDSNR